jgi:hypothetical protein
MFLTITKGSFEYDSYKRQEITLHKKYTTALYIVLPKTYVTGNHRTVLRHDSVIVGFNS